MDDKQSRDVIMELFRKFPKGGTGTQRLQCCMFSATLHSQVRIKTPS